MTALLGSLPWWAWVLLGGLVLGGIWLLLAVGSARDTLARVESVLETSDNERQVHEDADRGLVTNDDEDDVKSGDAGA